jgi:thiol-disulfide isomerase/thioredoxin
VDEVSFKKDSVFIKMPVFDSEFKCLFIDGSQELKGVWINHSRKEKNKIPFTAIFCDCDWDSYCLNHKFVFPDSTKKYNYECTFSQYSKESSKAIGIFQNYSRNYLKGSFLTETGDYRYLYGLVNCDHMQFHLSCFDGSHAFLFAGKMKGDSIVDGHFYSGAHHHETWVAIRNDKFELRDPDSLTYLKPGYTGIDFNFKNTAGKNVSLKDDKFKNKVVIIQLMGTWCPNCMDETKFLAPFYETYKSKGLEVVALAFERTDDFAKAINNIERSKKRFNANYEFLVTMKTGKEQASEALPMLNAVMAFPTTIFIDKKGRVRKIHTGFNGPATGDAYTKYVEGNDLICRETAG